MKAKGCAMFFIVMFLVSVIPLSSDTLPRAIQSQNLIGAWSGCAQGCTEFYRLELDSDGRGSLAILSPELKADVYRISKWTLQRDSVQMSVEAIGGAEQIEVETRELGTRFFRMNIHSPAGGWKRSVTLNNERDWDERTRRAKDVVRSLGRR
jgi:hypothetical protein